MSAYKLLEKKKIRLVYDYNNFKHKNEKLVVVFYVKIKKKTKKKNPYK